jgi:aryl-alcohol dehydrogenase-like predicted oxidoreductase
LHTAFERLCSGASQLSSPQACVSERIGILGWSPLGGGWLTASTGATFRPQPEERAWRVIDAVRSVADARGALMAQVALA